jgi:hypothetical protein
MKRDYYLDGYNAGKTNSHPHPPDKFNLPQYFADYYRGFFDGKSARDIQKEQESKTILSDLHG